MGFWRTRKFKALSHEWDLRLETSGFIDAEVSLKQDRVLKQRADNCYRQASEIERESRLEYYLFLGHLAHNTVFPNELEKYIMVRYSEGAGIKDIVHEIKARGISRHRETVCHIIRRWQTNWGIKTWSLKQRHLKK